MTSECRTRAGNTLLGTVAGLVVMFLWAPALSFAVESSSWKAGVATVVITPEYSMWMAGYAARNKPSEGKVHDLHAKALALEDAEGTRLVIVTADHETGALAVLDGLQRPEVRWASFDHSSQPVALFAYGPGAELFTGMYDNTGVALRVAGLLGFAPFPEDHPPAP